jgi:hypothetical protein
MSSEALLLSVLLFEWVLPPLLVLKWILIPLMPILIFKGLKWERRRKRSSSAPGRGEG